MVQAARLDLIRVAAAALLTAMASSGACAQPLAPASPLLQEGPLTTLLQPQKLDRSRPLLRQDGEGTGSADPATNRATNRATPCTRQGRAVAQAPASSAFGGGSGPGDYGRYLPTAPSSTTTPPTAASRSGTGAAPAAAAPPIRAPGVDRPLYGGTDRPLWDTGDRRPSATGKPAQSPDADKPAGVAAAGTTPAPAPARDRPLWADGSLMASADPAASAGLPPTPCIDPVPPIPR